MLANAWFSSSLCLRAHFVDQYLALINLLDSAICSFLLNCKLLMPKQCWEIWNWKVWNFLLVIDLKILLPDKWLCFSALNHGIMLISEAKPKAIFFSIGTHTNVERQHQLYWLRLMEFYFSTSVVPDWGRYSYVLVQIHNSSTEIIFWFQYKTCWIYICIHLVIHQPSTEF